MQTIEPTSRLVAAFDAWNRRGASFGLLALAALAVAVVTGIFLSAGYDVHAALASLALLELSSFLGRGLRAVHAWSSHLALVFLALHICEHLARRSEQRLRAGMWLKAVLTAPILLSVALTGFMLRGDADGKLARQVVTGLLELVPFGGRSLAAALLGSGDDLQLVYVLHAATLTFLLTVLAIEHTRRVWPSAGSIVTVTVVAALFASIVPPSVREGAADDAKGPWYFVALQEILHWLREPRWLWLALWLPLLLLISVRWLKQSWRRRVLWTSAVLLFVYICLGVWAQVFRGPAWQLQPPWSVARLTSESSKTHAATFFSTDELSAELIPSIGGRPEGCLGCHGRVVGLSPSHDPKILGCASCHLGNPFAPDAAGAHRGMVLVPGNLDAAERTCGQAMCHGAIVQRVRGSLMATASGMIAVDRYAFGEISHPDGDETAREVLRAVAESSATPAQSHLAQLCLSCHLGAAKELPAVVTEESRGGGCVACHLRDEPMRTSATEAPDSFIHVGLSVQVSDASCFGCHSRSGRISLSYSGWAEGQVEPMPSAVGASLAAQPSRTLRDGRVLHRMTDDVHHAKGMACIDCHMATELMGDGQSHRHEEGATRIRCETCHRLLPARSASLDAVDSETQAIVRLRGGPRASFVLLLEDRTAQALSNATPLADGTVEILGKLTGRRHIATAPSSQCTSIKAHSRLSCHACPPAWSPRCVGGHTQRDGTEWVEYDVAAQIGPPSLGLLQRHGQTKIEPVIPGMVMTLNIQGAQGHGEGDGAALPSSSRSLLGPQTKFFRAYAPAMSHTTTRLGRSCESCHRDPEALGFGSGRLVQKATHGTPTTSAQPSTHPSWDFEPKYELSQFDGVAADAWIAPFSDPSAARATRRELRPLELDAQQRTLEVGICMDCHDPNVQRHRVIYADFASSRAKMVEPCRRRFEGRMIVP